VSAAEECDLVGHIAGLPFKPFEFHGYFGKRRVVSFGWRYAFAERAVQASAPVPDFLLPLRELAASFAGLDPVALEGALVTEYAPGAGIGWHRDKVEFGTVVGLSFLAPCRLRFRRKRGQGWERNAVLVEPRSAYLLRGPSRHDWEHSIPPMDELRYSVTFRDLT
jgi:alkylated DNA repair dioxygenase AlkB